MIYILCPKPETPSGGVWFLGRVTRLLNDIGHPARLVPFPKHSIYWDANSSEEYFIDYVPSPEKEDTVIIPEVLWPYGMPASFFSAQCRKIVFVQNYIWIPQSVSFSGVDIMTCSRFLFNHMERVYHAKPIGKITPFLDEGVWNDSEKTPNKVLVMARRTDTWKKMVLMLAENDFQAEIVDQPLTQIELSERFSTCEYYVHLVYPEGFPMICLEAMRSGTVVVGTTGGGGNEFMFHNETSVCVQNPEDGQYFNSDEFCNRIIEQLIILRSDSERRSRIKATALEWSKRYTDGATKVELKAIFG